MTWKFQDGSTATASLLVGADGIRSTVRAYITPHKPVFGSMVAIIAAVPTSQLRLPESDIADLNAASNDHPLPAGIVVPGLGAFTIAPQTYNGDEVLITVQRPMTEAAEVRWASMNDDKEYLRSLFRQNSEHFPPVVQNAVSKIADHEIIIWPFYTIPRLERWTSAQHGSGRVVILGDSAHAFPPSAGQGVNQAFEDIYTFAAVLGRVLASEESPSNERLQKALLGWQNFRQSRVDRVLELNRQMDLRRMPKAPGQAEKEEEKIDLAGVFDWLFNMDFDQAIDECMKNV